MGVQCFDGATWLENTVIYSVLVQGVWQEGLNDCSTCMENTVIYSVLKQVVWQEGLQHCFNMCRKHCKLQCFAASCLARKLVPLLQHGRKTL